MTDLTRLPARFAAKVTADGSGCWVWTGAKNAKGYGHMHYDGKNRKAHRIAYSLLVAPLPDDVPLDHLCRNTSCVNPEHLEPVTAAENNRRAVAVRDTCKQGHPLDGVTYRADGRVSRVCKTCRNTSAAAARRKNKERAA